MNSLNLFTVIILISYVISEFYIDFTYNSEKYNSFMISILIFILPALFGFINKLYIETIVILSILIVIKYLVEINLVNYLKNKSLNLYEKFIIYKQIFFISIIYILSEIIFKKYIINISYFIINHNIFRMILLTLTITKPANVIFKKLFHKYSDSIISDKKEINNTEEGAGALIGNLERILSVIFLYLGQISAIGLIYTAKSIARFKQIEENRRFAEYYLIGTLYSILYAIVSYYLIMK